MKILYLHGWQSKLGGIKPTFLATNGHQVIEPALPPDDYDQALRIAQSELDSQRPRLVVGSSRGGSLAMNIQSGNVPLVLLAPAWKRWGKASVAKPGTVILHTPADDVVPFADSEELILHSGLPGSALIITGYQHSLTDPDSLQVLLEAVER